jgi:hypothetical protein
MILPKSNFVSRDFNCGGVLILLLVCVGHPLHAFPVAPTIAKKITTENTIVITATTAKLNSIRNIMTQSYQLTSTPHLRRGQYAQCPAPTYRQILFRYTRLQ